VSTKDHRTQATAPQPPDPAQLQHEVEAIRGNLGGLLTELDHRRHDALNLPLQLRRHFAVVGIGAAALLGLVVGGVLLHRARERRRQALPARLRNFRRALARMVDDPDQVARKQPRVTRQIITAGATATASTLGRELVRRLVDTRG